MKKLLILLLLVPSLSWGEESTLDFEIEEEGFFLEEEACVDNPNYNASKSSKFLNKRNVHHSRCLLKHNSSNSSLNREDIIWACWDLAYDKYPSKNYEGKYKNAPCED